MTLPEARYSGVTFSTCVFSPFSLSSEARINPVAREKCGIVAKELLENGIQYKYTSRDQTGVTRCDEISGNEDVHIFLRHSSFTLNELNIELN